MDRLRAVLGLCVGITSSMCSSGCSKPDPEDSSQVTSDVDSLAQDQSTWTPVSLDSLSPDRVHLVERAEKARDGLVGGLMSELMSAMQAEGPSGAIGVCSDRAPSIARAIAEEHDLRIGRTSQRLRNPQNVAPDWLGAYVQSDATAPAAFILSDHSIGVVYPIRIAAACSLCHGDPETLIPEVKDTLSSKYPRDQATGYSIGDLRGWLWVEAAE